MRRAIKGKDLLASTLPNITLPCLSLPTYYSLYHLPPYPCLQPSSPTLPCPALLYPSLSLSTSFSLYLSFYPYLHSRFPFYFSSPDPYRVLLTPLYSSPIPSLLSFPSISLPLLLPHIYFPSGSSTPGCPSEHFHIYFPLLFFSPTFPNIHPHPFLTNLTTYSSPPLP